MKLQPWFVPKLCRSCFSHLRIHTGSNTGLFLFLSKPAGCLILKARNILGLSSPIIANKCAEVPFFWLCQSILTSQQLLQESWGFLKPWNSLTHRKPPGHAWTQPGFKDWETFSVLEDPQPHKSLKNLFPSKLKEWLFLLADQFPKSLQGKCQSQLRPSETFTSPTSSKFPYLQQLLLNGMGQTELLGSRTDLPYSSPVNPTDPRGNYSRN